MAKQLTKKDLEEKLKLAQEVAVELDKEVKNLEKKIANQINDTQKLLQDIDYMLAEDGERMMLGRPMFAIGTINDTPKVRLSTIAYKISKLQVYKQEYFDLKDRVLPLPKTIILQEEHNNRDRRN